MDRIDRLYSPQSDAAGLVQVGSRLALVECPLVCFRRHPPRRATPDAVRPAAGMVPAVSLVPGHDESRGGIDCRSCSARYGQKSTGVASGTWRCGQVASNDEVSWHPLLVLEILLPMQSRKMLFFLHHHHMNEGTSDHGQEEKYHILQENRVSSKHKQIG